MTDYAIVRSGGKQYRVRPGDTVTVERVDGEIGDRIEIGDVLLASVDGQVSVGTPRLEGAAVTAEIKDHAKGKKVVAFRYKNKTRRRTTRGHRQRHTELLIQEITTG